MRATTLKKTVAGAVLLVALGLVPLSAAGGGTAPRPAGAPPALRTITLVTGDVVHVLDRGAGRPTITFEPGPNGHIPEAAITEAGDHVYVVPRAASTLVSAGKLDLDLFDVRGLLRQQYDDAHRSTMPVIVDYGKGAAAGKRAGKARPAGGRKTVEVPALGVAAFAADKERGRVFWRALTAAPDATGTPTALADGATRVDLDGRVHATVDQPVEQIHAPEAWAAGFDGTGTRVAVLDSGYDATHPDLAGVVTSAVNFTTDASTADGNGHGTHVASTIAGTGAASGGTHGGAAPGTRLLVGKVLADAGYGEDSWVLAGMQWAVAQGADVVSMSLGGDAGDGTDPLSSAIDELSATSDTLFVVAAGNNGPDASTVTAPGTADAALTVGAVDSSDTIAWFSSRGPRLGDGALKPDVAAPGVEIVAARAAGTSLGNPVDDFYSSLSGTSMATPHVAAIAAILAQKHPTWDGERLKAAIVASSVPVAGGTAFDVGTGRVDALRAIGQLVWGTSSLNLGNYPYPQSALPPTTTPLTYVNAGTEAVTLSLTVAAEDPAAAAPPGVSLSASTVTVPAGGSASVDVILDPALAGPGTFSGVVEATAADVSVRTALGFSLEPEHYDVTVKVVPRAGTQTATSTVALIGLTDGSYDQRVLTDAGVATTTFRVPPGTYAVGGLTFGRAADGADEGVLTGEPVVRVAAATTVTLDEGEARRFDYAVDRPVLRDGMIMMSDWDGVDGHVGFVLAGSFDRVFAIQRPSGPDGKADATLNWLLSRPDAEIDAGGRDAAALRAIVPQGGAKPSLEKRAELVAAGDIAALRTAGLRKAVAVVSGSCGDVAAVSETLAAAGAVAVVIAPTGASGCPVVLDREPAIPVFEARPDAAAKLLGRHDRRARVSTNAETSYIYDLAGYWPDGVPAGATIDGRGSRVASFVERVDSLGPATSDHQALEMFLGWIPARGTAAYGLVHPVSVPSTVTHYVSPVAEWERALEIDTTDRRPEAMLWSPRTTVKGGEVRRDRWFGGPLGSAVSPLMEQFGWQGAPYRDGDYLWMYMPFLVDGAGHMGSPIYLDEFRGELYRDGELVLQADDPIWMQTFEPAEKHAYRLVYQTMRANDFWQRSTTTRTEWEFVSQPPASGGHENLPLLGVRYDLDLSPTNTVKRARHVTFGVRFAMPAGVAAAPITSVAVESSTDGGATWRPAKLRDCKLGKKRSADGCKAEVENPRGGTVSLRVHAGDAAGRAVTQTIVDAYRVD